MPIITNWDYRPILHSYFQGSITDTNVKLFLTESDQSIATGLPYVLIFEAMTLSTLSSAQRKLFTDWVRNNEEAMKRLCHGQAYVVSNVLQRMIVRSVLMVSKMAVPYRIFSTTEDAWAWGIAQLEAAGVSFEERIRNPPAEILDIKKTPRAVA